MEDHVDGYLLAGGTTNDVMLVSMNFGMEFRNLKRRGLYDDLFTSRMAWMDWVNRIKSKSLKSIAVNTYMRTVNSR